MYNVESQSLSRLCLYSIARRETRTGNCILWSELLFFKNLFSLLFASYMTQYMHTNPHFITKREG